MNVQFVMTVVDAFTVTGRGIVVWPAVPISRFDGCMLPRSVELRFADGTMKSVAAEFSIPRVTPPPPEYRLFCFLPDQIKASVPAGTEVWADFEPA